MQGMKLYAWIRKQYKTSSIKHTCSRVRFWSAAGKSSHATAPDKETMGFYLLAWNLINLAHVWGVVGIIDRHDKNLGFIGIKGQIRRRG